MRTHPSFNARPRYCKNKEDPIKNEGAWPHHFAHYKYVPGIFPDAQGQLTSQSMVGSGQISNSSESLWLSPLSARMKKIQSKMKSLECSQHFPHYNSTGLTCCHGNQSSTPIWPKTQCSLSPHPNVDSDKIRFRLARWSQRYKFESVY